MEEILNVMNPSSLASSSTTTPSLKRRRGQMRSSSASSARAQLLCFLVLLTVLIGISFTILMVGFLSSVQEHAQRVVAMETAAAAAAADSSSSTVNQGLSDLRMAFGRIRSRSDNDSGISTTTKTTKDAFVSQSPKNAFPPKFPIVHRLPTTTTTTTTAAQQQQSSLLTSKILDMCERTIWHTLETTTIVLPNNETFIHTGDIDDLWLRDSAAQVHPYLVPFGDATIRNNNNNKNKNEKRKRGGGGGGALVATDPKLARIVSGLIQRTAMYIRHDPYANAFRIDDTYRFSAAQKKLGRHDLISTWNYELDSGCYFLRMIWYFYQAIPDHPVLQRQDVQDAVYIMMHVWTAEQNHEGDAIAQGGGRGRGRIGGNSASNLLDCLNCGKPYRYPGLARNGKGTPTKPNIGLTWTGFRPSDDECQYGYLIPSNMFAVVVLGYVEEMATSLWKDHAMAQQASALGQSIQAGIVQYGIRHHPTYGDIYAYEVDGLGHANFMDDANVPSLLSIPYLGYPYDPVVYANTRRFLYSYDNPSFARGVNSMTGPIEGIGSPHMERQIPNNIWPMSLAMQGLVSTNVTEKLVLLQQLEQATAGTGWMHESFDPTKPSRFTRSWFCWADALYAELVLSIQSSTCPSTPYKVLEWRDPIPMQ